MSGGYGHAGDAESLAHPCRASLLPPDAAAFRPTEASASSLGAINWDDTSLGEWDTLICRVPVSARPIMTTAPASMQIVIGFYGRFA